MTLSFSDTLTVLGIIISIIFGIWGIRITIRKNYPGKISFIEETALSLFNSIVRNFSEIKVSYNGSPINEQLIYVKANLINVGSIDLSTRGNSHKLKCIIPKSSNWLDAKITDKSEGVDCNIYIKGNNLEFDFDLLRKDEFFQFEALLSKNDLEESIPPTTEFFKFSHRIPNTSVVSADPLVNKAQLAEKEFDSKFRLVLMSSLFVVLSAVIVYNVFLSPYRLVYQMFENGTVNTVIVYPRSGNQLTIEYINRNFEKSLSVNEFNNPTKIKATIVKRTLSDYIFQIFLASLSLFFIIGFALYDTMNLKRAKRIIKILDKEDTKAII